MDDSYHCEKQTYYLDADQAVVNTNTLYAKPGQYAEDFKKYEYVNCTCECERYTKIDRRGRCVNCYHFGQADRRSIQDKKELTEQELERFALLGKIIAQKSRSRQE
jgi:hypothetical protein